jgi:hypothetical protein
VEFIQDLLSIFGVPFFFFFIHSCGFRDQGTVCCSCCYFLKLDITDFPFFSYQGVVSFALQCCCSTRNCFVALDQLILELNKEKLAENQRVWKMYDGLLEGRR